MTMGMIQVMNMVVIVMVFMLRIMRMIVGVIYVWVGMKAEWITGYGVRLLLPADQVRFTA